MEDRVDEPKDQQNNEPLDQEARELSDRREFLQSLGKWSTAAIAAIVVIEASPSAEVSGWGNRRESWINRPRAVARIARVPDRRVAADREAEGWLNSRGGGGSWVNRRSY